MDISNKPNRTRIAPTPSGFLHPGNALSFCLSYLFSKKYSIPLFLRIDDLDAERLRPEYLDDIFFTLDWLEIQPDEGPGSVQEFQNSFSQTGRLKLYDEALQSLVSKGRTFACDCTRSEIQQRTGSNRYDGYCKSRGLKPKKGIAVRADFPTDGKEHEWNKEIPYPILQKKDGKPAYHLASVVDDQNFEVNLIVRGLDLYFSSLFQADLRDNLGYTSLKMHFVHHPILVDKDGKKLSKSNQSSQWNKTRSEKKRIHSLISKILGMGSGKEDHLDQFPVDFDQAIFEGNGEIFRINY